MYLGIDIEHSLLLGWISYHCSVVQYVIEFLFIEQFFTDLYLFYIIIGLRDLNSKLFQIKSINLSLLNVDTHLQTKSSIFKCRFRFRFQLLMHHKHKDV